MGRQSSVVTPIGWNVAALPVTGLGQQGLRQRMNRVPPIGRLLTVLSGYAAAALAGAFIPIGGYLLLGYFAYGRGIVEQFLIPAAAFAFVKTVGLSLLPIVTIMALTEAFAIQAVFAYVLLGILVFVGCAVYLVPHNILNFAVLSGMISGGIVAGLVYWKIAGRNAGSWRQARREVA
jgi:hypothetical protein